MIKVKVNRMYRITTCYSCHKTRSANVSNQGYQVAPAELEAHLLTHPAVLDCAVVAVDDEAAGEVPKAFVVRSKTVATEKSDTALGNELSEGVKKDKSRHKWLKGGVEFIDAIPKSTSGKTMRKPLRLMEMERRLKHKRAKL